MARRGSGGALAVLVCAAVWQAEPALGQSPFVAPRETASLGPAAVDPTDATRLYVVYHDLATAFSHDVNVYVRVLHKNGAVWGVGPRIRINDDDTFYESDQFMPSIRVDELGRVHVIFCDDRNYNKDSDQPDGYPPPKFDVFYAYSGDLGVSWMNERLWADDPDEPALDWFYRPLDPREYNGIAWSDSRIWTTYTGTWSGDTQTNKAVILATQIDWVP